MVRTFQIKAKFGQNCLSFGLAFWDLNLKVFESWLDTGESFKITDDLSNDAHPEDNFSIIESNFESDVKPKQKSWSKLLSQKMWSRQHLAQ